ncbi:MAG TPA: SusC/RagA family TonB-linked outer membrane protein [Phnomibacter sp.]|nr:SusC/RagA family TonB-linked outer membrane protein [Phnomibacter sp.]
MRKLVTVFAMMLCFGIMAFAQTRTVKGVVKNEQGAPIPLATVTETGTKNAVTADDNGNFVITIGQNSKITISATGFAPITLAANSGVANVNLSVAASELQEVVVSTALGVKKQPRELGYSIAKIDNKEMNAARPVNVQNGLTGKVSGLNIATVNNGVFADTRITLRGIRSLTGNNQPLLVLDGSPVALAQLNRINPNDVDDITILKGASAASLYGPDGVNGVIYVKTKRGSKNGTPVITVSNSTQFETVQFMPKFQTQFGTGSSVDANGIGVYDPYENQQYGDPYDGSVREIGRPLPDGTIQTAQYAYNKNGRKNFFETGVTMQNDVSFSAKDFYLSAQDVNIKGTLGGDENRRTTFRFNSGKEFGAFRANFNVSYTKGKYNVATTSPYWEVFNTAGNIDLTKYKDWRNDPASSPNHYYNEYYQNPYFVKDRQRSTGLSDDFFAQLELTAKITNWLNVVWRPSATITTSDYKNTSEAFAFSDYAKNVSHKYNAASDFFAGVSDGASRGQRITSDLFINAQKEFGDFSVDGLLGQSYRHTYSKSVAVSGSNLVVPTTYNVSNRTGEPGASESNTTTRLMGLFGKLAFGYKNWAFIEFTGRNDWDSRLPADNQSFFYPGASASVVLSDAISSLKNSNFLSYLKLRGSWSKSGNVNVNAYALEPAYTAAAGFPYGSLPGFQGPNIMGDPQILPEFVKSTEVGAEVSFLKNRINIEVTAYTQNNTNQVLEVGVSQSTGVNTARVNAADFDNKGLEFDLRLTPLINLGNFRIDLKANYALQDSKVKSVYQDLPEIPAGNGNYAIIGYPAFMFKLTDYKRDPQGRIIVDRLTGYPSLEPQLKMFGRTMPKHLIGINPTFSFKGFALIATIDYRGGHQVYHGIGPDMDFTGSSARSGSNGRQRFIVPNSVYDDGTGKLVANTDVLTANGGYGFYESSANNRSINSNYLSSADAWKLRELTLGYTFPATVLKKTKVLKNAMVALTARNLVTLLPESNQWTDPEFSNTTGNALGVNNSSNLPPNRLYGFNIVLGF